MQITSGRSLGGWAAWRWSFPGGLADPGPDGVITMGRNKQSAPD
jgi:hypothetical protein